MRRDTVDDDRMLFVFLRQFDADLDMRAFHFVIKRFADIVQQAGAFRQA